MARKAQYKQEGQREGQGPNCLEDWKKDLENVKNALVIKTAETTQAYLEMSHSGIWEGKLKTYWENVDKTNKLILEIIEELNVFKVQANTVCQNTGHVVTALEVLFCYLRGFFRCTDRLGANLSALINQIKCLNEPNLGSSIILKCLNDLQAKLNAAIAGQQDILKLIVTILKEARILNATACTVKPEEKCGFMDLLDGLAGRFDHGSESGSSSSDIPEHPDESSCDGNFALTPKMPLENDDYYKNTWSKYEMAQSETVVLKKAYYQLLEEQKKLVDCKKSLSDAIDAAESAKSC